MDRRGIVKLAQLLAEVKNTVVLTGAGLSTASGIPDFTAPGTGVGEPADVSLLSVSALYQAPKAFYRYCLKTFRPMLAARPNKAHYILAALEEKGLISTLITQNIDGLHQRAGSRNVLEVHGHLRTAHCHRCFNDVPLIQLLDKVADGEIPPRCDDCGGMLLPEVVLFGDPLPATYAEAREKVAAAELLLVIGTSLAVSPANSLPLKAKRLAIINLETTAYDQQAEVVLRGEAVPILEAVAAEMGIQIAKDNLGAGAPW